MISLFKNKTSIYRGLPLVRKERISRTKGFTLVELLVTISMFVIITMVVLVNSNNFDNSVLLHNFAYDVALTIKQAQSYGVNVRENSFGTFNSPYGVYFNLNEGNTNYVFYVDINNDNMTSSVLTCTANDPSSECLQKYSMTKGTYIKSLCTGIDETSCNGNQVNKLSILFKRPNLGALIYYIDAVGSLSPAQSYAKIVLSSLNGATSSVVITSVGQIYVKK